MAVVCLEVNRNSLDRHESDGHVDRLEHDLRHAFAMGLGVPKNIREQNRVFLGRNLEFRKVTVSDKMSQESITKDIVSLEADRDNTAWIVTRRADTLNRGTPFANISLESKSSPQKKQKSKKEHNLP